MKPTIIPISKIQISSWLRTSAFLGDIFCKFYHNKKQLVWEMMAYPARPWGYLRKIVVPYEDVSGITFQIEVDKPSMMTVNVLKSPSFCEEINPQPGKNVHWVFTTDWTGGQASSTPKHVLYFPKNVLHKHLAKMLADETLKKLLDLNTIPTHLLSSATSQAEKLLRGNKTDANSDDESEEEEDDSITPAPTPFINGAMSNVHMNATFQANATIQHQTSTHTHSTSTNLPHLPNTISPLLLHPEH